jgi:hypothetical protein
MTLFVETCLHIWVGLSNHSINSKVNKSLRVKLYKNTAFSTLLTETLKQTLFLYIVLFLRLYKIKEKVRGTLLLKNYKIITFVPKLQAFDILLNLQD